MIRVILKSLTSVSVNKSNPAPFSMINAELQLISHLKLLQRKVTTEVQLTCGVLELFFMRCFMEMFRSKVKI